MKCNVISALIICMVSFSSVNISISGEIHEAALNGDLDKVKKLIESGEATPNELDNINKYPPLVFAIKKESNTEVIRYLIDSGADLNWQHDKGMSLLSFVVTSEFEDNIAIFVQYGLDLNSIFPAAHNHNRYCIGCNALHMFFKLDKEVDNEIIMIMMQNLVNNGININAKTLSYHETALHMAVKRNDNIIIRYLLQSGANPNIQMVDGKTALHLALPNRDLNQINTLIEFGANVNARDHSYNTPLHIAVMEAWAQGVQTLIDHGADSALKNRHGNDPWHIALDAGLDEIKKILKKY